MAGATETRSRYSVIQFNQALLTNAQNYSYALAVFFKNYACT